MTLSNFLAGRACDPLIREVFAEELIPRSQELVEDVRAYIQKVVAKVCELACGEYPFLLDEIKTRLLEEFMTDTESKAKEAVLNVCYPELNWTFTQNASYETTLKEVEAKVEEVHKTNVSPNATLCGVPAAFIQKSSDCISKSGEDAVRVLQVWSK